MKLTVIYADNWAGWNEAEAGLPVRKHRRRVTVELTTEQAKALESKIVGNSGPVQHSESLVDIFLEP